MEMAMCHSFIKNIKRSFSRLILPGSVACLCVVSLFFFGNVYALNLKQAEQLAIESDPGIEKYKATSRSFDEASIADDTLPDPRLRLGAVNVPVDTFDLEQEQMTQLKIGIQQDFPRGDSLALKQQQSQFLSRSALAMADDVSLKIVRDVRENYLNLYYEISAYQIIRETRQLFSELVKITESNYAAGRVSQQDVVLAGLELSRLDDRATKIQVKEDTYRANLSQWIGPAAWNSISLEFPELPELPENFDLNKTIPQHPLIRAESAKLNASKKVTEMARQQYKPSWSLLLDYGYRQGDNPDGTERSDFASAIVSLDVPLFTGNRQDKTVASNQQKIVAARYQKDDQLRNLKQLYDKNTHLWQRLGDREELYKNSLLKASKNNSKVALNAYQSGVSEFNTLMRAQITELDVRLEDIRIRIDRAIAKARILYVTGDPGGDTNGDKNNEN
jgi:outer membrane protein TolC